MNRRTILTGLAAAAALWALLAVGCVLWLLAKGELPPLPQLSFGELWMHGLKGLTIVFLGLLGVGCAYSYDAQRTRNEASATAAAEQERQQQAAEAAKDAADAHHRFAAQVVGVQWLNPLAWMDYPTEWNALWTLGLAKPNADDAQVKAKPEKYAKVRSVAGIAFNIGGGESFAGYYHTYIVSILGTFRERYFTNKHYFYSVAEGRKPWRELAGIHVEISLPPGLDPKASVDFAREEIAGDFAIGRIDYDTGHLDTELTTSSEPPHLNLHQGGAAAGFASVEAALDYLEAHPDKTAWVLAYDAPSFPKPEQINETGALLVLAHPDFDTGREPLAWIQRASRVPVKQGAVIPAWQAALTDAAERGQIKPEAIGYVIHDAGQGDTAASRRLGDLARSATETLPALDFAKQNFNTSALLGELRTGTAATNLVLAIAYAHHKNTPVIVAGTRETAAGEADPTDRAVTAVLVRPPAHPRPFDPQKTWFRARGGGNAYLPWWSRRHDANPKTYQGWSD